VRDGDIVDITIDRTALHGTVNFLGTADKLLSESEGARQLGARQPREDLAPHPALPEDTRLWAALVQASGGVWGGCVYDTESIVSQLKIGTINQQQSPIEMER